MAYSGKAGLTSLAQMRIVAGGAASSTLSGNATLDGTSPNFVVYDPGGADRTVTLPAEDAWANAWLCIANAASGPAESLSIADDGATEIVKLSRGEWAVLLCDGSAWYAMRAPGMLADVNTETLSGAKTLVVGDAVYQRLDPGGAGRDVTLPAEADSQGLTFRILNTADAAEDLTVKDDGASTIVTVSQNEAVWLACDGTTWTHQGIETIALS